MSSLAAIGPGGAVAVLAMLVLVADMLWPKRERVLAWLSAAGLAAVFLWTASVGAPGRISSALSASTERAWCSSRLCS